MTNSGANIWTAAATVGAGSAQGPAAFAITATDLLGNAVAMTATTDASLVTVDTTPPTLSVPANLTVPAADGVGATVTFAATATDNLDPAPVVISNPASGSIFPSGTTTVTVTATDAAGNAASGSFTVTVTSVPEIAVELPAGTDLIAGGVPVAFDTMVTGSPTAEKIFTIRNPGSGTLSGLTITLDGPQAGEFAAGLPRVLTLAPGEFTTFTLSFTPVGASGLRSATLHLASNDADENPFEIALTGQALSFASDTDGDGLNDVAEFNIAALGYDWQLPQPARVATLMSNANLAGRRRVLPPGGPVTLSQPSTRPGPGQG